MSPSHALADTTATEQPAEREPDGYRYHLLRAATERFQRNIPALSDDEHRQAETLAQRSFALEELVLHSPEAADVLIPETQVQGAFDAVAERYANSAELESDLAHNGLDPEQLRRALRRELLFDAVMQRVGAQHAPITEADERLFYELHHDRFATPETRSARHILITTNDDYAENTREAARARLEAIAARLNAADAEAGGDAKAVERFAEQAKRASECPTALEGGRLGKVRRGQLYPELDAALFALTAGAISEIVETELGFHLLLCETVEPAQTLAFSQVRAEIHEALERRRRKEQQRQWLAGLQP
ncbi:nitrogen fixation protein NifM [Halochromatium glycolicum]|uniref:peptidylprolyl isomerase n=1 Tax=Halochromatium glycolicum TaxID=85075 RepID=A0AAJ0U3B6_9GAMM|nr:nitrogen fixation protein NifM [Halochromatium glycolicum]MBK1704037.1 nitrogen fixation protein NifM [Halochromatium glycolicum]